MEKTSYVSVRYKAWTAEFREFDKDDHILRQMRSTGLFYEEDLLEEIFHCSLPGSTIVDVGSCIGTFTIFCSVVLRARVVSVEPSKKNFVELKHNIKQNKVGRLTALHNLALANVAGRGILSENVRHNAGARELNLNGRSESGESVEVRTLKAVWPSQRTHVLKIDVEGMEESVLLGGIEDLSRDRPLVICECQTDAAFSRVYSILCPLGYKSWRRYCVTPTFVFFPDRNACD